MGRTLNKAKAFRLCFAYHRVRSPSLSRSLLRRLSRKPPSASRRLAEETARAQRGLVVGVRLVTAGFFAAGLCAVVALAFGADFFLATGAAFFLATVDLLLPADAPAETRDECLVRCRTTCFFGAASAIELTANTAMSATSNIFIVL
jgi:hypothetical protein